MSYWLKWEWEEQCSFCKKRRVCTNKPQFKKSIKNIKQIFDEDPATENATLTIECNNFSVDKRKYEEFKN